MTVKQTKNKKEKKKKKRRPEALWCLTSSDDGWTNIKHYANVNDQINLFYSFPALDVECRWCINMVLGLFFFFFQRGNEIASFWFSLRSVTFKV